jgi:transposase
VALKASDTEPNSAQELFKGRHFDQENIVLCVRWYLGLCPNNSVSGGKVLHRATRKVYNRAADTLRLCAQSLTHSKSALGAKYRRLKARLGAPKAIVAMAHHFARLVYRMLRYGQNYVEQGIHQYELKFQLQRIKWLKKEARSLNLQLVPA